MDGVLGHMSIRNCLGNERREKERGYNMEPGEICRKQKPKGRLGVEEKLLNWKPRAETMSRRESSSTSNDGGNSGKDWNVHWTW